MTRVAVAGASGRLGSLVVRELAARGATVRAVTRRDFASAAALADACRGARVVVSALAGLRDVMVERQTELLDAAVAAGAPRFIPSDFAIDFTKLPAGANRNLGFRSEFRERLDRAPVQATSILCGAFADMLTGRAPFILFKQRRVLCWGDPDQLLDFTTVRDVAAYTAAAALDETTPRFLRIAGDQVSARSLAALMTEITGERHALLRPGGLAAFRLVIKLTKLMTRDKGELYPPWQGMQYMHDMYEGRAKLAPLDNDRYPMAWTSVRDVLLTRRS